MSGGVLSGVDFGGEGTGVLLVHGSGHNCAAWSEVASYLVAHCHAVAFDLRGHGHTEADSRTPEQYARRAAEVRAVVRAGHGRRSIDIDAGHNLPMTRPAELAAIIVDLVHQVTTATE
ncbi:alpha/beta fold hydrolase [Nocardia fusca]|uniref:alpha/beta fold hydrolase n=1 Tax=Nocardia fusca TaxID=941183 RepID=UPI0037C917D9